MPLIDHFRRPTFNKGSWEGFHGMWPALMVMDLCRSLPEQYTAEPRVHLGKNFAVDVCTFAVGGQSGFDLAEQQPRHFFGSRSFVSTDVQCVATGLNRHFDAAQKTFVTSVHTVSRVEIDDVRVLWKIGQTFTQQNRASCIGFQGSCCGAETSDDHTNIATPKPRWFSSVRIYSSLIEDQFLDSRFKASYRW